MSGRTTADTMIEALVEYIQSLTPTHDPSCKFRAGPLTQENILQIHKDRTFSIKMSTWGYSDKCYGARRLDLDMWMIYQGDLYVRDLDLLSYRLLTCDLGEGFIQCELQQATSLDLDTGDTSKIIISNLTLDYMPEELE